MRLMRDVLPDKLRGGYYTSAPVVDWCIAQVMRLTQAGPPRTWLEPSAGDGAFIHGIARTGIGRDFRICAVERDEAEAARCSAALKELRVSGTVCADNFFAWAALNADEFDALVGNPPYVRYQFVQPEDRALAEKLTSDLGLELKGVSNLWIPFALIGMSRVRIGGAFALVLPSELFATVSGGQFRSRVVRQFESLRVDLFPRETFPDILQDVVVVSGRRARDEAERRRVTFCEQRGHGGIEWTHTVEATPEPWVRHLLTADEGETLREASRLPGVVALGSIAKLEVSIVTGANSFFTVDDATLREWELEPWGKPLLAKTADCAGLVLESGDRERAQRAGRRVWLLDFSESAPDPLGRSLARKYIAEGERLGLASRYKCRTRSPWYRVPHIRAGSLMMPKRAHRHHRLILNEVGALTTDTIYRGEMRPGFAARRRDLAACFQNSLTMLSAEIEGRTYGGGVLELVPSEIARLLIPLTESGDRVEHLDVLSRATGGQLDATEAVLDDTDDELERRIPEFRSLLATLRAARARLQSRRWSVAAPAPTPSPNSLNR